MSEPRAPQLIDSYYIRWSNPDCYRCATRSISAGKWHRGTRGQVVYEKAQRRVRYAVDNISSEADALGRVMAWIREQPASSEPKGES